MPPWSPISPEGTTSQLASIRTTAVPKLKCLTPFWGFLTIALSCNQISCVFSTVNTQKCKLLLHKKSSTERELDVPGTCINLQQNESKYLFKYRKEVNKKLNVENYLERKKKPHHHLLPLQFTHVCRSKGAFLWDIFSVPRLLPLSIVSLSTALLRPCWMLIS